MSDRFRIGVALWDARQTRCADALAELALGLNGIVVCKSSGRWQFACGSKDRLNGEFEYFGREDIGRVQARPS